MTDLLENDLSRLFAARADEIPAASIARVASHRYDPRLSRLSTPARVAVGAGGLAATGAAISAVLLGTAPAAFAGWSATPTAARAKPSANAPASCLQLVGQTTLYNTVASLRALVTDVRGPFTLVIYAGAKASATCLTGPGITVTTTSGTGGPVSLLVAGGNLVGGDLEMVSGPGSGLERATLQQLSSFDQGPFSLIEGRVTSGVSAVTLRLANDALVQATVGGGWFLAWWPGDTTVSSAHVTTSTGQSSVRLHVSSVLPRPGQPCPTVWSSTGTSWSSNGTSSAPMTMVCRAPD